MSLEDVKRRMEIDSPLYKDPADNLIVDRSAKLRIIKKDLALVIAENPSHPCCKEGYQYALDKMKAQHHQKEDLVVDRADVQAILQDREVELETYTLKGVIYKEKILGKNRKPTKKTPPTKKKPATTK